MVVWVRPSNEALRRARVLGARDWHGCHFAPFPILLRSYPHEHSF
jgi:hypothetical protein